MPEDTRQPTRLAEDYRPFPLAIDDVALTFRLAPDDDAGAVARSASAATRRAAARCGCDGEELTLIRAAIDGIELAPDAYTLDDAG